MDVSLTDGTVVHVDVAGQGSSVVLLHGVMMSGRFFGEQLAGDLPKSHELIVPDYRGHGASEKVQHGHTVAHYAQDLRDVLASLATVRPVLVGWSMGAMVAWEYVKRYGCDSVAGIVVVDQPPSDFGWEGYEFGLMTVEGLAENVKGIQTDQRAVAETFADLMQHAPLPERSAWIVEEIMKVPAAVASTILTDQTLRDYRSFLPVLTCPCLVAFGLDPKMNDPSAGQMISDAIPGSEFVTFENSSHMPFLEEPGIFDSLLTRWISNLP